MLNVLDTASALQPGAVALADAGRRVNASAQALDAMGTRKRAGQMQEIFDVILAAQRRGEREDFTLNEVQLLYERNYGERIDIGRVSARVSDLLKANRLVRLSEPRVCSLRGTKCCPVLVPAQQARLVA